MNCLSKCGKCLNGTCNNVDGSCECTAGWNPPLCIQRLGIVAIRLQMASHRIGSMYMFYDGSSILKNGLNSYKLKFYYAALFCKNKFSFSPCTYNLG